MQLYLPAIIHMESARVSYPVTMIAFPTKLMLYISLPIAAAWTCP